MANQKLDSYERSLAVSKSIDEIPQPIESFYDGFHHSFLLLTTIGSIDTDDLSIEAKIFSIFYSIFGIPLVMLYLNQCVKAISSFWQGFEVYAFFAGFIFVVAILYDVIEQTSDDTVSLSPKTKSLAHFLAGKILLFSNIYPFFFFAIFSIQSY